ncbi:MAG: hypothetical protein OK441_01895 [Thaumarchaeota archaeon]|nr:hypothetical protein [Nitrososphaerota archaeon]
MSEVKTFFRHCPSCGRRFHIRVVSKQLLQMDREDEEISSRGLYARAPNNPMTLIVEEGEPITVDIEEFQYMYKCKHCGHEWSEKHVEEHKED